MTARFLPLTLAAFIALSAAASAQTQPTAPPTQPALPSGSPPASGTSTKSPQAAPNPGAAEAKTSTVRGPGGYTTEGTPESGSAPARYGTDPASGNDYTASPPLGPQQNLGQRINRTVHYIAGDYIAPPLVYNGYAGPSKGTNYGSRAIRGVFEIPLGQYNVYVGGEARKYQYLTRAGTTTGLAGQGTGFVRSFAASEYDADVRAGIKVIGPRIYGAVSYLVRGSNFEPRERGVGVGIEKLADVDQNFSLHGNVFFYPNVNGAYSINGVGSNGVSYREVRYLIGASIQPNHSPVFLDAGFLGDRSSVRRNAPVGFNHQGPYVGLGIHF